MYEVFTFSSHAGALSASAILNDNLFIELAKIRENYCINIWKYNCIIRSKYQVTLSSFRAFSLVNGLRRLKEHNNSALFKFTDLTEISWSAAGMYI